MGNRMTISDLPRAKRERRVLAAVSCYDCTTAHLASQGDINMILVGFSAAQLMLGFDSTLPATMDLIVSLTAAVRPGTPNTYLLAGMPFLSYQASVVQAIRNAGRFLAEAGAQRVKRDGTGAISRRCVPSYPGL